MRLVYMDEAGTSRPDQEPFITVAGVIVHGDHQLAKVCKELTRIREEYIPREMLEKGFVFHAYELIGGVGKFGDRDEWPDKRRFPIADEIMAVLAKANLYVALGWVEQKSFADEIGLRESTPKEKLVVAAHGSAFIQCAALVERWMREHAKQEHCILVIEDHQEARPLIRSIQTWHQDPANAHHIDERTREFFPFRKIQEDPLFQPKKKSNPLELADFCAYVWKKHLNAPDDPKHLRFANPMFDRLATFSPELRTG